MAYGFKPNRNQSGGTPGRMESAKVENAYATALYAGDPVRLENGFVVRAETTERVDGIFLGARWVDATTGKVREERVLPAATTSAGMSDGQLTAPEAKIAMDMSGTYMVQADGAIADANVYDYFVFAAGAGSDVNKSSGYVVTAASATDTAAGADVQVIGVSTDPNNPTATPNVEVRFLNTPVSVN